MITLYYFSGTGNSYAFARELASGLGDTDLISMAKAQNGVINANVPAIGFVFPVYAWGMPRIVADFIEQLQLKKEQYVFAIATCGKIPGGALSQLAKAIRKKGGYLQAGFVVSMPNHTPLKGDNPVRNLIRNLAGKNEFGTDRERIAEIMEVISNRWTHRPENSPWSGVLLGNLIHPMAISTFVMSGRKFEVEGKCNSCRTCERVCPRENIRIKEGKPSWGDNCELCFACLQWCPAEVIRYQEDRENKKHGHHPEVTVQEMLLR